MTNDELCAFPLFQRFIARLSRATRIPEEEALRAVLEILDKGNGFLADGFLRETGLIPEVFWRERKQESEAKP